MSGIRRPFAQAWPVAYDSLMSERVNLMDPSCEPTDEQLAELMRLALADVLALNEAANKKLDADITKARAEALASLKRPLAPR